MKLTFGRKFLAAVIATAILTAAFFATLLTTKNIGDQVIIIFMILIVTVWFMYIGGNVWSSWIKSKYFRSELQG